MLDFVQDRVPIVSATASYVGFRTFKFAEKGLICENVTFMMDISTIAGLLEVIREKLLYISNIATQRTEVVGVWWR